MKIWLNKHRLKWLNRRASIILRSNLRVWICKLRRNSSRLRKIFFTCLMISLKILWSETKLHKPFIIKILKPVHQLSKLNPPNQLKVLLKRWKLDILNSTIKLIIFNFVLHLNKRNYQYFITTNILILIKNESSLKKS